MRPSTAVCVLGLAIIAIVIGNCVIRPGNTKSAADTIVSDGE